MLYKFRIIRTQTAERSVRATDEDAAMEKVRAELAKPYGFLGRWEDAALTLNLSASRTDTREAAHRSTATMRSRSAERFRPCQQDLMRHQMPRRTRQSWPSS